MNQRYSQDNNERWGSDRNRDDIRGYYDERHYQNQLSDWGRGRGRNPAVTRNEGYMEDVWQRSQQVANERGWGDYQGVRANYEPGATPGYGQDQARFYSQDQNRQYSDRGRDYGANNHNYGDYQRSHGDYSSHGDYNRNQAIGAYSQERPEFAGSYNQNFNQNFNQAGRSQSFRGRGPKGYQRTDQRIQDEICERLSDDPYVDASDVTVTCSGGVVTLEGSVDKRATKHRIEDIVDACGGVKDIENRIRVSSGLTGAIGNAIESVKDAITPNSRNKS